MKLIFHSLLFLSLTANTFAQKAEYHFSLGMYGRTPVMNVMSTETFACSNNGIYIRQGWSRDTLFVRIIGIDSRVECNNVVGKARETVGVNGIRSNHFVLRFLWEGKANYFRVEFDGESFTVKPEQSDFITFLTN